MEINKNHLKINESQSKPRVASAGIAKPSNKKTESCIVFKHVFFQMAFVQGRGLLCSLLTGQDLELAQAPRNSVLQASIARWLLVLLYAAISCRALYQSTNMGIESKDRGGKKFLLPRPPLRSQC